MIAFANTASGRKLSLNPGSWQTEPAALGSEALTGTPQALAKLTRDNHARWGKIIKAAGIKGD